MLTKRVVDPRVETARQLIESGNISDAEPIVSAILAEDPEDYTAHSLLVRAAAKQGNLADLIKSYYKLFRFAPQLSGNYINQEHLDQLGSFLAHVSAQFNPSSPKDTLTVPFQWNLSINDAELHLIAGFYLYERRYFSQAEQVIARSIQIKPTGEALLYAAACSAYFSRYQEAIKLYVRAMQINPQIAMSNLVEARCLSEILSIANTNNAADADQEFTLSSWIFDANQQIVNKVHDAYERWFGRVLYVPPRTQNFVSMFFKSRDAYNREFLRAGAESVGFLRRYTNVGADSNVLDLGCGFGRCATAFTQLLSTSGRYVGIDVVAPVVEWCRREYGSYSNIDFQLYPMQQSHYVRDVDAITARAEPSNASIPFALDDGTLDLQFSFSLFTHLSPDIAEYYLKETARCLKSGGMCSNTFFIIDGMPDTGFSEAEINFAFNDNGFYCQDDKNINLANGYSMERITAMYKAAGLEIVHPIQLGDWCKGRTIPNSERCLYFTQDVVIARKV